MVVVTASDIGDKKIHMTRTRLIELCKKECGLCDLLFVDRKLIVSGHIISF